MKSKLFTILLVLTMIQSGCKVKEKADVILINGQVYTVDSAFSVKQAFAVIDGMFVLTGSNEEILGKYESGLILDAGGKPVYPGLIDGHCHFYSYATTNFMGVNLRGTNSFEEVLALLKEFHEGHPGNWITGAGWDQNDWETKTFPVNNELDQLFPEIPVVITRIDGHAVLANSAALKIAGITAATRINGGKIIIENGHPSGILLDNAADLMKSLVPPPGEDLKKQALLRAQQECFSFGLTSVVDAGLFYDDIKLIDSLQQACKLNIRINAMLSPDAKNIKEFVEKGAFRKEKLTVNSIKLYADGALGSRGALLLEPYSDDPGNYGLRMSEPDYYREILLEAYEKGYQVNTHCIGDSANRMMLHLYGEVLKGPNDRRWRIEHAQVVHPNDFQLFAKYSIIPSVQSTHCTSDMYWAGERLGPERVKGAYAYKELLQQNGWLINGTDFPVEEINPMLTFYAAVARKDLKGYPESGFQIESALSREEALRSMTSWAAKGSFEEDIKGSIEAGKFADFIILDKDIMQIIVDEIPGVKVLKTYLNGELVYE
jgi:predicted amidohydrolase YtcJ